MLCCFTWYNAIWSNCRCRLSVQHVQATSQERGTKEIVVPNQDMTRSKGRMLLIIWILGRKKDFNVIDAYLFKSWILLFNVIFNLNSFRFIIIKTQQDLRDFLKTDDESSSQLGWQWRCNSVRTLQSCQTKVIVLPDISPCCEILMLK